MCLLESLRHMERVPPDYRRWRFAGLVREGDGKHSDRVPGYILQGQLYTEAVAFFADFHPGFTRLENSKVIVIGFLAKRSEVGSDNHIVRTVWRRDVHRKRDYLRVLLQCHVNQA